MVTFETWALRHDKRLYGGVASDIWWVLQCTAEKKEWAWKVSFVDDDDEVLCSCLVMCVWFGLLAFYLISSWGQNLENDDDDGIGLVFPSDGKAWRGEIAFFAKQIMKPGLGRIHFAQPWGRKLGSVIINQRVTICSSANFLNLCRIGKQILQNKTWTALNSRILQ